MSSWKKIHYSETQEFFHSWSTQRQLYGDKIRFCQKDKLFYHLYGSFSVRKDGILNTKDPIDFGGIFNLQYANDG